MKQLAGGISVLGAVVSAPVPAEVAIRTERAQFKPGETGATVKGEEIVDYKVRANAGGR